MATARANEALSRMERSGGGHMVFIGSVSAMKKGPGSSVYAATKAGAEVYAETLRNEVVDKNIKVSWIEPGAVGADMQEKSPEEQREANAKEEMLMPKNSPIPCDLLLPAPHVPTYRQYGLNLES